MIVLSNIRKLYDGTSATEAAIHQRVDLWIDTIPLVPINPAIIESTAPVIW